MPKIVLQVTHGPRWDHKSNRYLQNGEEVALEAASDGELLALIADHEVHCRTILQGIVPKGHFGGQKAPEVALKAPEPPMAPLEPKEALEVPQKAPEEPKKAATKGIKCPKCGQGFKTTKGLDIHFTNTGHNRE
jgi:hypothetical protein